MKIYDCLIYNNELDLLHLRLNILNEVVDKFIIVEGNTTFSGNNKSSDYLKNKNKFKEWEDKIIYKFIDIPTSCKTPWDKEIFSRNYCLTLPIFKDEDIIISSDLDEIPRPEVIKNAISNNWVKDDYHLTLKMDFYMYYINNFMTSNWYGSRIATYKYLKNKSIDDIRETTEEECKITGPIIENAGWHFSYFGGEETIKHKIESFSHMEFNNQIIKSNILKNIQNNTDLFNRNISLKIVEISEKSHPKFLIENLKNYKNFIK